jgi:hypothetical protein
MELDDFNRQNDGPSICALADYAIKMVEGDPNFMTVEHWLSKFKPTKLHVDVAKRLLSKNSEIYDTLKGLGGIEDAFLSDMMKEYSVNSKTGRVDRLPSLLSDKIAEIEEVKQFVANDEKLTEIMKNKYPLIRDMRYTQCAEELVYYINAKYEMPKKRTSSKS